MADNIEVKEQSKEDINKLEKAKLEKFNEMLSEGKNPFIITKYDVTNHSMEIKDNFDAFNEKTVTIAGRLMLKRVMGKASFANIQDRDGNIQIYVSRDDIGEDSYKDFKKYDIGDIIGVKGFVFRTQAGEISVHAKEVTLLSKSLAVLPEKFHGFQDRDLRYRQRYIDLIMNPDVKKTFIMRSKVIREIRNFLDARDFIEVETPMLVENAGGANARPFETHFNALNEDRKLRISLELYLKRLIVGGLERVYEIGRVFRNEGTDTKHNPEFTLMELYQAYTDYNGMMELTESMFKHIAKEVTGSLKLQYGDNIIDLEQPFAKISMIDAVKKYSGVDFTKIETDDEAKEIAKEKKVEFLEHHKRGDILNLFFDEFVEKELIQPTFVIDHPIEVSPLTKKKPDNPSLTERFELYINGYEMANAYSELNDPIDQRERFEAQEKLRALGDEEANSIDEDFLTALKIGMPPTGGIGYGIDRLVMLMTNSQAIRDVLLFPTLKSEKTGASSMSVVSGNVSDNNGFFTPNNQIDFSNIVIEPLFTDMVDFETFSKSDFRAVKVKECVAVEKSKKLLKFTLDDGTGNDRIILSGIHAFYEPIDLIGKTLIAIVNLPPRNMMGIDSCGMLLSAICKENGEEKLNLLIVDNHIPAGAKLY
ncbi:MAG: lysine--tRNA ligase [Lachnospiraceae bacterium]|nr:lysine--tRNA ligase [Lachnospiraceae bacterium]